MKGGSGRKKPQEESEASPSTPAATGADEEQIYADEAEEDEEEEDEEGEEADDEQRPKLAEGFFEIEAVRAKRTRKGQRQYLIKWRGWPETANTWEPFDNLQSCSDIIHAFEQRTSKSYRKRKRKHSNLQTQSKKKQQRPTTSNSPSTDQPNDRNSDLPSPRPPPDGVETGKAPDNTDNNEEKDSECNGNQGLDNVNATDPLVENGPANSTIPVDDNQPKQTTEADHDPMFEGMPSSNGLDTGKISIQVADTRSPGEKDDTVDDQLKQDTSIRFIGAKRRKSGRVKRVKQDLVPAILDEAHPSDSRPLNEPQAPDMGDEANLRNSVNPSSIVRIIEPLGFSTSVFNNIHNVSLNFRAVRSDGQVTEVDNKFLKAHNPQLLIDFYEQHLRYTPSR